MEKEYYTSVSTRYGKIYYRGYHIDDVGNKKRVHGKLAHTPKLYTETESESEFKSLYGNKPLQEKTFESLTAARDFIKSYKDVMPIYGYSANRFEYEFIARNFPSQLEIGIDDITVGSIDIETTTEHGKINVIETPEEILLITYQNLKTKELITFGSRAAKGDNFVLCKDEKEVLAKFINHIQTDDPDVITGWNVVGFDLPYIINRTTKIISEEVANRLSPFGVIEFKDEDIRGHITRKYTIVGRTCLDMLELYKKFTYIKRDNYRLQTVAMIELGVGKLENPYSSFKEFYTNDPSLFLKYNQVDTIRVSELEDKLGLISLAMSIAYKAKINYGDVYGPVKTWECMLLSTLMNDNIYVPVSRSGQKSDGIVGAYVHNPVPGFKEWIVSIDAEALYPSIAVGLNMSPETLLGMNDACSEAALLGGADFSSETYSIAANGAMFTKDTQGIIPRVMQELKDSRSAAKREMLAAKQKYIETNDIAYKKISDLKGTSQLALKILNNSGYGAISNSGFIFFDNRIAEGITMTGRYIIQYVSRHFNTRLNEFFKTDNIDYVTYMDTDSSMFSLGNIVKKYYSEQSDAKIVEALDKLVETHLRKFIDEATDTIAKHQNYYKKTIYFKREKICSSGFWLAPKKYALKVYDNEGVRYAEPDYAITGIEVVRSSTPEIAREALRECVKLVINKDIDSLRKLVTKTHSEFKTIDIERIAFPRGANNLVEYSSPETIYKKGCPIAVRGALLHNHYIEEMDLDGKYQPIEEGSKLLFIYLKEPNHFKENVIAFTEELPPEFNLHKFIDRELQFQKVFLAPLEGIMKAVGWELEEKQTLEDFFG